MIIESGVHQGDPVWLTCIYHVTKSTRAGGVAIREWHAGVGVAYHTVERALLQARILFNVVVAALLA